MYKARYELEIENDKKLYSRLEAEFKYDEFMMESKDLTSRQRILIKDKIRLHFGNKGYELVEELAGKDVNGVWTHDHYQLREDVTESLELLTQAIPRFELKIISVKGLIATICEGVLPNIFFASVPKATTLPVF
jgi:hypothetical protein